MKKYLAATAVALLLGGSFLYANNGNSAKNDCCKTQEECCELQKECCVEQEECCTAVSECCLLK